VAELCNTLSTRVMQELIEPLCVSALNTTADQASAQVFLRVLQDALFGLRGGSDLLLPRVDLTTLFPAAAVRWLQNHGTPVHTGQRVTTLRWQSPGWQLNDQEFDRVIWATSASNAAAVLETTAQTAPDSIACQLHQWVNVARALQFEAITTVYSWGRGVRLTHPMLALRTTPAAPAQFVFDRGQLGGPPGLLAFVVSASQGDKETLQTAVLRQAQQELGLSPLQPIQTVVEKRATFQCTPALIRPPPQIAPGLWAAGDYVAGPYPATLEGAVRSGWSAGSHLSSESP
jgi:predicted NAD/FAD-dependent oxidoreductase